jgi:hypothetical protein
VAGAQTARSLHQNPAAPSAALGVEAGRVLPHPRGLPAAPAANPPASGTRPSDTTGTRQDPAPPFPGAPRRRATIGREMSDEPVRLGLSMRTCEALTSGRILAPDTRRATTGAASSRRARATS